MTEPLKPGSTIGILGGGQLGRMLCIAAGRLGFRTIILEPGIDCPAAQFANEQIVAPYDDQDALRKLNDRCDAISYEFENVPADAVEETIGTDAVRPSVQALRISQDRLTEKDFVNQQGISTASYKAVTSENLKEALKELGGKAILKTRRFGYDGKGQQVLTADNLSEAETMLAGADSEAFILEGFVEFAREISVIAARSVTGEVACYDVAENVHSDGILRTSTVPAEIDDRTAAAAHVLSKKMLNALDYVGVIGIEFFCTFDGDLIVNEFAPRVHNSGHWTEAACAISQFEQHIRAISGLPLGDPVRHSNCVMENLIGDDVSDFERLLAEQDVLLHLYGKAETRGGRKMGHLTRLKR